FTGIFGWRREPCESLYRPGRGCDDGLHALGPAGSYRIASPASADHAGGWECCEAGGSVSSVSCCCWPSRESVDRYFPITYENMTVQQTLLNSCQSIHGLYADSGGIASRGCKTRNQADA